MKKVEKIANYNRYEPDYNDLAFDPASSMPRCDIEELQKKLDIAVKAMTIARDAAYCDPQDCPKCGFIDDRLTQALEKIKGQGK